MKWIVFMMMILVAKMATIYSKSILPKHHQITQASAPYQLQTFADNESTAPLTSFLRQFSIDSIPETNLEEETNTSNTVKLARQWSTFAPDKILEEVMTLPTITRLVRQASSSVPGTNLEDETATSLFNEGATYVSEAYLEKETTTPTISRVLRGILSPISKFHDNQGETTLPKYAVLRYSFTFGMEKTVETEVTSLVRLIRGPSAQVMKEFLQNNLDYSDGVAKGKTEPPTDTDPEGTDF